MKLQAFIFILSFSVLLIAKPGEEQVLREKTVEATLFVSEIHFNPSGKTSLRLVWEVSPDNKTDKIPTQTLDTLTEVPEDKVRKILKDNHLIREKDTFIRIDAKKNKITFKATVHWQQWSNGENFVVKKIDR
jgi:hypothetical protein